MHCNQAFCVQDARVSDEAISGLFNCVLVPIAATHSSHSLLLFHLNFCAALHSRHHFNVARVDEL